MIEFLFRDLDDTILDFAQAERVALARTLSDFGVEPTGERTTRYSRINKAAGKTVKRKAHPKGCALLFGFQIVVYRTVMIDLRSMQCFALRGTDCDTSLRAGSQ